MSTYVVCLLGYAAYRNSVELGPDDYAIYSACLRDAFLNTDVNWGEAPEPFHLVIDADVGNEPPNLFIDALPARWAIGALLIPFTGWKFIEDTETAAWDMNARRLGLERMDPKLALDVDYSLVSRDEIRKLYWRGSAGEFSSKYPNNLGYVEFSRIGYSLDRQVALLAMYHECGLCGASWYVKLERQTDGEWQVSEIFQTGVS